MVSDNTLFFRPFIIRTYFMIKFSFLLQVNYDSIKRKYNESLRFFIVNFLFLLFEKQQRTAVISKNNS